MPVYHLPPQALAECACFSVASESGSELLVIPYGCTDIPTRFDGYLYLPWEQDAILSAPITPQTLIGESLAAEFLHNPVIISSQLCGGTLKNRLEDAREQYGERVFFCIEPMRHLLPLPCPNADPQKISSDESQSLQRRFPAYYTDAFCCNYCIDPTEKTVHLFDTKDTIQAKIELAESLGISQILCLPT